MFMGLKGPRYATTDGLAALAKDSVGRNRGPTDLFYEHLDPHGIHVCALTLRHGPNEERMMWLCKMANTMQPVTVWIDCNLELAERKSHTMAEFSAQFPNVIPQSLAKELGA